MKITSIRHDKDAGREMMTVYDADVLMEKMKTETRDGYVTGLRTVIPQLEGTESAFSHIDKLPRVYPAVCCFLRFQRKECENMGVFRPAGWKLTEA